MKTFLVQMVLMLATLRAYPMFTYQTLFSLPDSRLYDVSHLNYTYIKLSVGMHFAKN